MDVSEAQSRDYPRRLYPEGSSNLEELERSPIGVIAKLAGRKSVWSGRTVHYLLCRQLRVYKKEIWSFVVDQPIRFSLHEFGEITGLKHRFNELKAALEVCPPWSFEKRKWLGLLLLQAMGLYALHHNSRIPFESAKRIFDDEAMMSYPWGQIAYEVLVDSIKMLDPQGRSYTINGMKDVLLVWAYEFVSCFGERFGRVVKNVDIPLLRWGGKRTRASFATLFSEEMREPGELKSKAAELKKQESDVKETELKKQKVTQIKKEKVAGTGTPPHANIIRVKFKNTSEEDNSLVEVTDEIRAQEHELLPESDVEEEELIISARIKEYRERSVQLSPKGCALMTVSPAPVFPYIGDNGTTCMRKKFQPSSAIYDPLAPVDLTKFEKFMQHINLHQDQRTMRHVAAYMKVLIGRSMRDPTPFWSKRIAFIDPWFITLWVHDFKQFKVNPNLMKFKGTGYEELSMGRIPYDFQTNLKWFEDVDHLYGVLQVSGDHWVVFHVDLKKEKIDCYDPSIGQVTEESETKMVVAFKPLSQMLHVMLNDIVPANLRKPSKKQFTFRRRKGKYIPQNTQLGDCGVYSLKFIECLALGVTFDGINDENIEGLRVKMATKIHDKRGNSEMNNILS
ncbi:hypothetical protein N665_0090s0001 [Sinapis alba]|nr:hypothetical protein N665_0090s0001 [Sinapis alba]